VVVADPGADLVRLVTAAGDPPPSTASAADLRAAHLLRRRFGLALPPPFVAPTEDSVPIRVATAHDGPAIACVKWRVFGTSYRGGVLADDFLDGRDVVPSPSWWVGRAMVPPSRRHRLLVWGRPGTVLGYLDAGPVHPEDADPDHPDAGEVYELYVDPVAQGRGGGGLLLDAAERHALDVGWDRMELNVLATNPGAQAFYRARGWAPTGGQQHVDLGIVAFDEVRYATSLRHRHP
jgi:ribosomal protein S18 acetylase RimI-like enzyme